jgi:hypothetical protein
VGIVGVGSKKKRRKRRREEDEEFQIGYQNTGKFKNKGKLNLLM